MTRVKTQIVATDSQLEKETAPVEETEKEDKVQIKVDAPVLQIAHAKVPYTGKALAMKKMLEAEPKEMTFIPLAGGEKLGVTHPVILNGYPLYIPKGVGILVPKTVKEVLDVKLKQLNAAASHPYNITGGGKEVPLTQYGG
jgi:hypothetical protein